MLSNSLSHRIVAIVVAGFAVATLLFGALVTGLLWPSMQSLIVGHQKEGADLVATQIQGAIDERITATERLASMIHDGQKMLPRDEIQQILDSRILLHRYYNGGLIVLDAHKQISIDSPVHPGRVGVDLSDRDYVQRAFESGQTVVAPPVFGRGLLEPVFIILSPMVADSGESIGAFFGVTKLAQENLLKQIGEESLSKEGSLYIVDTQLDLIVTSSDPTLAFKPSDAAPIAGVLAAILEGKGSGVGLSDTGQRVLYASAQVPGMEWRVIRTLPYEEAFRPLFEMLTPFVLIAIGIVLLLAAITLGLLKRQLRPLKITADTLDAMAGRKLPGRSLPVARKDEIGRLITSFNRLIQMRTIQKAKMLKAQGALKKTLASLQDQVDAAVIKAKEQERVIHEQNRRHALLNLLVNLAHQWRQPLNTAGLLVQEMEEDFKEGALTPEQMHTQVAAVMGQLKGLSKTITHFTDLYQANGEIKPIPIAQALSQVIELVGERLKQANLHLISAIDPDAVVAICPADLIEALIQLLENTLTTAKRRNLKDVQIDLSAQREGAWVVLLLEDSAGGFEPNLLPTLFDPYATEGYKEPGRGLGLFHLREMVVGRYRGEVEATNGPNGAIIKLKLPAAQPTQERTHEPPR